MPTVWLAYEPVASVADLAYDAYIVSKRLCLGFNPPSSARCTYDV